MVDAAATEVSVEDARPIELYTFAIDNETFRYTSSDESFTFDGFIFDPVSLQRGKIGKSSEVEQTKLIVTLPTTDTVATKFIGIQPADRMDFTADVVMVNGKPCAKVGRKYNPNPRLREVK